LEITLAGGSGIRLLNKTRDMRVLFAS